MKLKTIENNVKKLHTPYCDFTITDDNNNAICFDVLEAPEKDLYVEIYNDYKGDTERIPVVNGDGRTLRIHTAGLKIKQNYHIRTSVTLKYLDADERLFTHGLVGDDYIFAVSFPDPNDEIKWRPTHTEYDYHFFDIKRTDETYTLRLYDYSQEYIDIFMFWIWDITDNIEQYESVCTVATWQCP